MVFFILDVTPDNEWVIVSEMSRNPPEARGTALTYSICNIPKRLYLNVNRIDPPNSWVFAAFEKQGTETYVRATNFDLPDTLFSLREILEQFADK